MPSTRDRILDALQDVLLEEGPAGATLDVVAHRGGVSKGGLLYHFRSKDDLFEGLLGRLDAGAAAAEAATPGDPGGAARWFLDGSQSADGPEERTMLAALRLLGTYPPARARMASYLDGWAAGLHRAVDDPVLSRLVQLVGDGLFLHALLGAGDPDLDGQVVADVLRRVGGTRR
ncbi:TetR/AcrR family transcriptional regulator [Cellulomonas shaoxiangyii]|uniref:TetR/AcrR family transcriptional regulator n=1 Tax=Cellulomonas shaoxiangyii TaxID=2566013 RepID=A0A4V1CMZ2_9CELL|nr:TetR/AcrR family transcriptional regulator [Cellulomonas shaoxiangyii]QCB94635.1 TetR/AcrR family transcriptional regulator [Cellulomonas shaoxiangyii]TGY81639.1 TetR/AcrR family transcriptional regulator [Cellulomonas shaoxiangyii]